MPIKSINTLLAAQPLGHYSQAQSVDGFIYVSGILPVTAAGKIDPNLNFTTQTEIVMQNAAAILNEAGSDMNHVVKSTVYVVDVSNWGAFDIVYARHFGAHRPARAVVPVVNLHHGFLVEVDMFAKVKP